MAKTELHEKTNTKIETEDSTNLKGTLASVFTIGFLMVVTWVGVYALFVNRF